MKSITGIIKISLLIILGMIMVLGCSGNPTSPVIPGPDGADIQEYVGNRSLWGIWDLGLNVKGMEITATPRREINPHFDITLMISPPKCEDCVTIEIVEFNPQQKYAKLKLTLTNNTPIAGYDVRGIIESNAPGFRVTNADSYTSLWDSGGDIKINPFKAFAVDKTSRKFSSGAAHTRIYEIEYDQISDLSGAALVVDASWPANCKEPYEINNFIQGSTLPPDGGATNISLDVLDWQYDAVNVYINATPIGGAIIALDHGDGNTWSCSISTDQVNTPGTHRLHVYAGSEGTNLILHNYFKVDVAACSPEGNEIPETGTLLPVGGNSGDQIVCLEDKIDWYIFFVTDHLFGQVRLKVLDQYGPADLAIFSDPHGSHLKWVQATFGEDGIINANPLNLGTGTYYLRVRHIGNDANPRDYILYNQTGDSVCAPDGNDSYGNAIPILPSGVTDDSYVCPVDKQDWFTFHYDPGNGQYLRLSISNQTGPADMTLYNSSQAGNPDGPHLAWKQADPIAVMNLDDFGIPTGDYYIRVRHIGSDTDYRKYKVFNLSGDIPCFPEGNESAETATDLPMGQDSGVQVVCLDDQVDWYTFVATDKFIGDISFTLLNDTGECEISLYSHPPVTPIYTYTATYDTPVKISLDFNLGIYYMKVKFLGEDTGIRQYILENQAIFWPCHPEGNENPESPTALPYGDTGIQEICYTDMFDYYRIICSNPWSGEIRLKLLNDTGPVEFIVSLPWGPVLFSQVIEFGTDAVFKMDDVDLGVADFVQVLVSWTGGDDLDIRQYTLYNYTQAWPCMPDYSNNWDSSVFVQNGTETEYLNVCRFDEEDWFYVTADEQLGGNITMHASNSHYEPASVEFFADPNEPPLLYKEFYTGSDAVLDMAPLHLGSGTFYLRVAYIGDDYLPRLYKVINNIENLTCGPDGNDSYVNAISVPFGDYAGPDYVCLEDTEDWFTFEYDDDPGVYIKTQIDNPTGPVEMTLYSSEQALNPDGPNITSELVDPVNRLSLDPLGLSAGTYYIRVRFVGSDEAERKFFVGYIHPDTGWVRSWGQNYMHLVYNYDWASDIDVDANGDLYVSGYFNGEDDFDPGPCQDIHTSVGDQDGMVARYNHAGDYIWGVAWSPVDDWGIVDPTQLVVDGDYLYVVGSFYGQVDFDPGPMESLGESLGGYDCFLSKFDLDGNFIWARTWGGTSEDGVASMAVDNNGDIYTTGTFNATVDFDPGAGVDERTSAGAGDSYLWKINPSGGYQWVRTWGGTKPDSPYWVTASATNYVFVCGTYRETVDLDPSPGVNNHTSQGGSDSFLSKFSSTGDFVWGKSLGGNASDIARSMAFDPFGNLFIAGSFSGTTDLDPGAGVAQRTAGGFMDGFMVKLNSSDQFVSAFTWGGSNMVIDKVEPEEFVFNSSGVIFLTGDFNGTVDFDPGGGVASYTTPSDYTDVFTVSYGPSGNLVWAHTIGAEKGDWYGGISLDQDNNIYTVGSFGGVVDFDPGVSTFYLMAFESNNNPFLLKYLPGGVW